MPGGTSKRKPLETIHIIMVGTGGVGKSALTSQFMYGTFPSSYHPTRADSYNKQVQVDGTLYNVDILDTAGQESYAAIRDNYFRSGDGFFCVFSINDKQSFNSLLPLRDQICRAVDEEEPPMVLVGNKADLLEAREVMPEEANQLVEAWGNCVYLETSAKQCSNVNEAFLTLLRSIIVDKKHKLEKAKKPEPVKTCCIIC